MDQGLLSLTFTCILEIISKSCYWVRSLSPVSLIQKPDPLCYLILNIQVLYTVYIFFISLSF